MAKRRKIVVHGKRIITVGDLDGEAPTREKNPERSAAAVKAGATRRKRNYEQAKRLLDKWERRMWQAVTKVQAYKAQMKRNAPTKDGDES